MKTFLSFVKKEFTHIMRDWITTLIVLVMPVVLVFLFGFAISTEIREIKVMFAAPKHTETIRRHAECIKSNPTFCFEGFIDMVNADNYLRSGKAQAIVVYSPNYEQYISQRTQGINTPAPVQIITDASDSNISASSTAYLQQALNNLINTDAGMNIFATSIRHNPQLKSSYNFVPGIMGLIFILICAIMTSVSIVKEKETGTMEVLLVSPVKPQIIIFSKMIPYFVISCVNLATILVMVRYAMDVPLESLGGIISISIVYIMLSLAIGMLVSTVAEKQIVALLACAMLMMLPMMLLSGMIFPVENLPLVLKPLPYIVPAKWYIEAIRKLMIAGVPFSQVIKEFCILLGMLVFVVSIAFRKFNDRLSQAQ